MTDIAPVQPADARNVIADAFNRYGIDASSEVRQAIMGELESNILFDHATRRIMVADTAGNPVVELTGDGTVQEVSLDAHLSGLTRQRSGSTPAPSTGNPFHPDSRNLTAQALMMIDNPDQAARLKEEVEAERRNPFGKLGWNRTRQTLLRQRDPHEAARLEQEAAR